MAKLLYGDKIAEEILEGVAKKKGKKRLKLVAVQVGENAVSEKYLQEKERVAQEVGISFEVLSFPKGSSQKKVREAIERAAKSSAVSGIIVQLPLPAKFFRQELLDAIPPDKDVDVLSAGAFGQFALQSFPVVPPTARAIVLLLEHHRIALEGKHVVIVGAGRLVGLPTLLHLLSDKKATVTVVHDKTKRIASITKEADILISGVGKRGVIRGNMVKKGAVVIDAGTSVEKSGTAGDVDFNNVVGKVRAITPVPGGVGPLTVACLLENLVVLSH